MMYKCFNSDCPATISISESVSSKFKFACRDHVKRAADNERFQETQFDSKIGPGTDPKVYERGYVGFGQSRKAKMLVQDGKANTPVFTKSYKRLMIEKAEAELAGHENSKEILKILNQDVRDSNSGTAK